MTGKKTGSSWKFKKGQSLVSAYTESNGQCKKEGLRMTEEESRIGTGLPDGNLFRRGWGVCGDSERLGLRERFTKKYYENRP